MSTDAQPNDALSGRIALVTGGSGGIGAAICRLLAAHGADVAVGYGQRADAAEAIAAEVADAAGVRAIAVGADLFEPDGPGRLVEAAQEGLGPIDILVANHGHARVTTWDDVDAEAFDRTLAINLRAPFFLAQAVLGGMLERGWGRILFVSSTAALRGGVVGPDYTASKSGLHGLTFYLSGRVAADGVTVNAIAPGFVETAMLPGDPAELGRGVPVGRVGRPEEAADLAVAILRNGYVTNHVFSVDGGMHPR
ncbi:MAG: SDR family NAD(P)-dependent oxidoreductase [Solirubrobacteraceae bacterium]